MEYDLSCEINMIYHEQDLKGIFIDKIKSP